MLLHEASPLLPRRVPIGSHPSEPGPAVRLLARLRSTPLDELLIAGADPRGSRVLAARAAQLTARRHRAALAAGLERLGRSATEPGARMQVRPRRASVLASEAALTELADRLRSEEPVYAGGVARLARLLSDGRGPAYRGAPAALAAELESAAAELGGRVTGVGARSRDGRAARGPNGRPEGPRVDPPGFVGSSFVLPDGSWYHGRRDGA